jgi:hypothetical protein
MQRDGLLRGLVQRARLAEAPCVIPYCPRPVTAIGRPVCRGSAGWSSRTPRTTRMSHVCGASSATPKAHHALPHPPATLSTVPAPGGARLQAVRPPATSRNALAHALPASRHLRLRDNRGAPPAARLPLPEHAHLRILPPDGPALHPLERGWHDRKADVAWRQGPQREAPPDELRRRRGDDAATRHSLTGTPDRVAALHALCL